MTRLGDKAGYEASPLRRICGDALRVGGTALTRHGLALCGFSPGARLLDVGCGPGVTLALLRELGYRGIGADISAAFLGEIKARSPDERCLKADMGRLPLRDGCLDGILYECVLSQARDKAGALREAHRALAPRGRLLLADLVLRTPPAPAGPGTDAPLPANADLADAGATLACVRGAVTPDRLGELLREAAFHILRSEDHTALLRELTAKIVWERGSLADCPELWSLRPATGKPGRGAALCRAAGAPSCGFPGVKLGYLLVIAEKLTEED
jgi:SAM-dependent methyltransferase